MKITDEQTEKPNLKLFVWDNCFVDWSHGLAFAIAPDEETAKKIILNQMEISYGIEITYEIKDWGRVKVCPLNMEIGFGVWGGA